MKKLYNPDSSDFKIKSVISGEEVFIVIPANGYAIVSDGVANAVQQLYSTLEVTESTLEEYQDYRLEKQKAEEEQKKLIAIKAKADAKIAEIEAKKTEAKLKARHEAELKAVKDAEKAKIAVINNELGAIAELEEKTVQVTPNLKVAKKKGKKK